MSETKVFDAQTADGNSSPFKVVGEGYSKYDARWALAISGTFGSGTVTIQGELPDDTFEDTNLATITEPGLYFFSSPPFIGRLSLAGATSPSINAWVIVGGQEVRAEAL